jgi:hypothetical protein
MLRKLGRAKLGEWVFGSAMAWGCMAPSAALTDLLGGQSIPCCAGSQIIDCIYQNGSACVGTGNMPHFCGCFGGGPGHGVCTLAQNPCTTPCAVPPGYAPGTCNTNSNCYY